MAFTIYQEPLQYTPVYNDINYLVSSTNTAQPNFNYIFDIKINGTVVSRHRIPARPENGYGLFNAKRIVENYLTQNFAYGTITVQLASSSILKLNVDYYEEYGSTPTLYSISTSPDVYCWTASLDPNEWVDYTYVSRYRLMPSEIGISQLLTNNATHKIKLTERATISALVGASGAVNDIGVFAYNSAGTLIKTTYILNPYWAVSSTGQRFINIPAGTLNLNQILNANLNVATQNQGNIIPSNTSYYIIKTDGTGSAASIPVRYNIDDSCSKYEPVRIYFLNKLGAYDAFTFDLVSRENNTIERKKYRRNLGGFSGTSFVYTDFQRANIIYDTQINETLTINSNWITDAEAIWLEELLTSPITYMETASGIEVVNVINSDYEVKKTINDKLFNLQITLEKSYIKTRQRG
ncbi:hypothetical protein [Brevundimonas sp.]|jgi:hypothetical protein|uniref:hypothetical protein n=1 Tax=Brevundimonas sp. TaxID=1871086 RepID=UPI003783CD0F